MQEQEGFDDSQNIELVQFNYRPLHIKSEIKKRPSNKPQQQWQITRDSNRGQWAQSVVMREPQNVVFSSNINQVTLPETQFIFEAEFEGSNLDVVIRKRFLQYELYIRPDTNTETFYQWFDFKVKCCKGSKAASFTIKNLYKSGMLYAEGLKPYYRRNNKGNYQQLSSQVKYYENIPEDSYCLKFTFQFLQAGQPPYSYSKMINLISQYGLSSRTLCKSYLGKRVPYITFNEKKSPKAIAVVIARQHPGQSVGSWMMEGLITKLNKQESLVQWIVVPMMCVDGVILGNNRTGLPGYDYNRFWNLEELSKKEKLFPQIIGILNVIKQIRRVHPKKPKIFIDLHGHSSQPNIFTYGTPHDPNSDFFLISKVFPELLARKNENFNLEQCSSMIKPDKKNTIRGLLYYQYLLPFVYTVEASFGIMRNKNVNQLQYLKFGSDLVGVTEQFLLKYVAGQKTGQTLQILDSIKARGQQIQAVQYDSDAEQKPKQKQKRKPTISTDRAYKRRLATESPVLQVNRQIQQTAFQLFRVQQDTNQRYAKPLERKRTQTQVTISKTPKITFLPKLKQSFNQKPKTESKQEHNEGILMNIKQIQKKLHRLKNNRIGKKILIINSYGT